MDLYHAADVGDLERVKLLVKQGADMEYKARTGKWTPLIWASRLGHLDIVRYLFYNKEWIEMKSISTAGLHSTVLFILAIWR